MPANQPLTHPVQIIRILAQIALGAMFLWAAYPKIQFPPDFAHMVYNYKLSPCGLINLVAIYLPWVEAVAGVALITNIGWRGANGLVGALLVFFITLLAINLARGHAVDCGCFELHPEPKTEVELFADMKLTILRDVGMLAMVGYIFIAGRFRGGKAEAPTGST